MIYWILTDVAGEHARRSDGDWEVLERKTPTSDDVERFHRHRDAVARAAKLKTRGTHCKVLRQEYPAYLWRLPNRPGESDMVDTIEFPSKRQAAAWVKRAIAEGCEVIECLGIAKR